MKIPRVEMVLCGLCLLGVGTTEAAGPGHDVEGATPTVAGIVCDEPVFDFGERDNDETVIHVFEIRNDGKASLEIARVRTSCGCTVAELGSKVLLPGEATTLTVRYLLRGRKGRQHKSIQIYSNDPERPILFLWIKGAAISEVAAEPPYVNFTTLAPDARRTEIVKIVGQRKGLSVEKVMCDSELVVVKPWSDAGGAAGITVTTKPPLPTGTLRASIKVLTNHPDEKKRELTIPVFGAVKGDLVVIPNEIVLRSNVAVPVTRTILLRPGTLRDFEVRQVTVPDESITVQTTRHGAGTYRIELHNCSAKPDLKDKSIQIETSASGMKHIEVPIRIVL